MIKVPFVSLFFLITLSHKRIFTQKVLKQLVRLWITSLTIEFKASVANNTTVAVVRKELWRDQGAKNHKFWILYLVLSFIEWLTDNDYDDDHDADNFLCVKFKKVEIEFEDLGPENHGLCSVQCTGL